MYEDVSGINDLQWLICHKTIPIEYFFRCLFKPKLIAIFCLFKPKLISQIEGK